MKKLFLPILVIMAFSQARAQEDMLQENDFMESPDAAQAPQGGQQQQPGQPGADSNFAPPAPSAESYEAAPGNPNGAFNPSKTPSLSSKGLSRFKAQKDKGLVGKNAKEKAPPLSQATDADITNENYPDIIESFDFPNADISDVIKAISELTGKNFIVDTSVSGKITIMAPTQITVAEAYKVFLSALAIRGFAVVPSGKFLKILPVRDAQRDNIDIYSGAYTPDTDQMITRIIHLKYVPASEMNKFTSKLVSKNGNIDIYEPTNSLIVSDQASSVQRIMKIVGQLDIASFDEQLVVIHIRYAKAKDMADLIEQIINKGQKNQGSTGFGGGIPRFRPGGTGQSSGSSAYSTVIPDDRTNSIIVVGNKDGIEKIKKLVATLDNSPGTQGSGAYVYYVKYGDAEKIADILNGIAKSLKDEQKDTKNGGGNIPPPPTFDAFGNPYGTQNQNNNKNSSSGLFGADVKISADKQVNSLVIVGSRQDYQAVLSLLKKIDIPRDQVYVETVIMEMEDDDANNFGLSYYHFDPSTGGLARAGFGGGGASAFSLNNLGNEGAILGFGTGDTVNLNVTNPGGVTSPGTTPTTGTVQVKSLMGLLNLIKSSAKTDILATPRILAMDNEKSVVEVGANVPVGLTSTATVAGAAPTQSVDRVDATIKLEIKPFISPSSESVRMELKQTIKDLAGSIQDSATALSSISRSVTNRSIETTLVVRDGDTAVLGGLKRNKTEVDVTKVPLLGDIPILGWLFKSSKTTINKLNLIVFLTPRVIRNPEDNNMLLSKTLDDRIRYIKENEGGVDKFGATAENLRPKLRGSQKSVKDIEDIEKEPEDEFIEKK